ncbi:MAG: ComEC/Rec2 family competence protein [Clostridia bacterium]|nr:ComEC/Rec2 family competence protein [Clostridia bacterium]
MQRPFALIGFSYFIVLLFLIFIPNNFIFYLVVTFGTLFLISIVFPKTRNFKAIPILFAVCFTASLVYFLNLNNTPQVEKFDSCETTIEGIISEQPYKKRNKYYYTIKTEKISEENVNNLKILVHSNKMLEGDVYDKITFQAYLYKPFNTDIESKIYNKSKNIPLMGKVYEYKEIKIQKCTNPPLWHNILKTRNNLISATKKNLPNDYAAMINGILLGEKNEVPPEIKKNFEITGIYHLLTVSGIHLSIISSFIFLIFLKLKLKIPHACFLASAAVAFFMAITCFTPSVLRAGIMMIIFYLSRAVKKDADPLNSLGIGVGLTCAIFPHYAYSISLWLSFLATLGIIVFYKPIFSKLKSIVKFNFKFTNYILSSASISLSCAINTFPISVLIFKKISTVFVLSGVLTILPITILLVLSLLMNALTVINFNALLFIIKPIAISCGLICKYILDITSILAKIPYALILVDYGYIILWISFTMMLISVGIFLNNHKKAFKYISLLSGIILLVGTLSNQILTYNTTSIHIANCGSGIEVILSKNGEKAAILSIKNTSYINEDLLNYTESANYINLTASEDINLNEMENLIKNLAPNNLEYSKENITDEFSIPEKTKKLCYTKNSKTKIWNNTEISSKIIKNSTYIKIKNQGKTILILPNGGDAEDMPDSWLNCDIMICCGLPSNYKKIKFKDIIVSDSKNEAEKYICKINSKNIFSTFYHRDINIFFNRQNEYFIRRFK